MVRLFLCVVVALVGNVARAADVLPSADPILTRAEALINRGEFNEALVLLRAEAPLHPHPLDAYFMLGLSALEVADRTADKDDRNALLDEAIFVLHNILIVHPNFHRVRLELARAFFLKGDDELAKEHFERVLAVSSELNADTRIKQFLSLIRARRRWDGYFSFAIAPDSNINNATDEREVYFFGLPFRLNKNARSRSGLGAMISAGGEYRLPLNEKIQWRTGVNMTRSDYGGGDYDQTVIGLYAGPRFLLSPQTEWSALATGGQRWVGGNRYSREFGARLESVHRLSRRLIVRAAVSWARHSHRANAAADGANVNYRLGADYYLSPTILVNGYTELFRARPRQKTSRYRGHKIGGGLQWALGKGWTVGGGVERLGTQFRGATLGSGGALRRDKTLTTSLHVLNRSLTIGGFSPQIRAVRENRQSNGILNRYRRYRGEIRFMRQF